MHIDFESIHSTQCTFYTLDLFQLIFKIAFCTFSYALTLWSIWSKTMHTYIYKFEWRIHKPLWIVCEEKKNPTFFSFFQSINRRETYGNLSLGVVSYEKCALKVARRIRFKIQYATHSETHNGWILCIYAAFSRAF